jgi:flagellar biosynthesis chaperone FliJ
MSRYPLMIVLELRKREEEAAAATLADATRELAAAQAEAEKLAARLAAARHRWQQARDQPLPAAEGSHDATTTGLSAVEWERFGERRRAGLKAAEAAEIAFRNGSLAKARREEAAARAEHLAARQSREILDKHAAKFHASQRLIEERRESERLDDSARLVTRRTGRPGA